MKLPQFQTFGCRLNAYETEAMRRLAGEAGLSDAVVVNTCAVTSEAVRQARQQIRRAGRENPDAKIVVTGCAAQTDPAQFSAMPEVHSVLGNREKLSAESWKALAGDTPGPCVQVSDIMQETRARAPLVDGLGTRSRAYVQIQNGCDHRCTFCIIPFGRGNSRSVPKAHVLDQIARLTGRGFNEVVLTGVDLTSWGADLEGGLRLGDLVAAILTHAPQLHRLRLSSIDSVEADPALMECIASEPRLMPHFHLSLQHGDNLILKRMKRRHSREDAIGFCEAVRERRPDAVFGADIIAGFPTESEAMFANSLRLVDECGLTWLHVFPFSAREGTPAARMPQLNGTLVRDRAARLREAGAARVTAHLDAMQGRNARLLMETTDTGRTEGFARTRLQGDYRPGEIVPVRITGQDAGLLLARAA